MESVLTRDFQQNISNFGEENAFFFPLIARNLVLANADQELLPENSQIKDIERS